VCNGADAWKRKSRRIAMRDLAARQAVEADVDFAEHGQAAVQP
jgi:hypothetical protein